MMEACDRQAYWAGVNDALEALVKADEVFDLDDNGDFRVAEYATLARILKQYDRMLKTSVGVTKAR